jgi:potassium/chloride transporter 9
MQFFTGPSIESLRSNIHQSSESTNKGVSGFLSLFSIVFAAFSGLACGANCTGDVRDAGRSIPRGMLFASLTGIGLFAVMSLIVAATMYKLVLVPNRALDVVLSVTISSWVVVVGMTACCLGAAVVHLVAAANCIRSMVRDTLIPYITPKRFPILNRSDSFFARQWHQLLVWFLAQCSIFAGSPAKVAPLLSLTYLFFISVMNAAVFLLVVIGAPSFRPRFRHFNRYTTLLGTIVPLAAMFPINAKFTFIIIGIFFFLLILFSFTAPDVDFGDTTQALLYHQVRKYLLRLGRRKWKSAKFWRPSLLLLELRDPEDVETLGLNFVFFANAIKKGGLMVICSVIVGLYNSTSLMKRESMIDSWQMLINDHRLKALPICTVAETIRVGVRQAMMLSGLGNMKPNTLMMGWFGEGYSIAAVDYGHIIRDTLMTDLHIILCRGLERIDMRSLYANMNTSAVFNFSQPTSGSLSSPLAVKKDQEYTVDVWCCPAVMPACEASCGVVWADYEASVSLCIQLANTLRMKSFWASLTRLRIITVVQEESEIEMERQAWTEYLSHVRMRADVVVLVVNLADPEGNFRAHRFCASVVSRMHLGEAGSSHPFSQSMPHLHRHVFEQFNGDDRLRMVERLMKQEGNKCCLAFLPLCPPPLESDLLQDYLTQLDTFTKELPPIAFGYSKINVIYTDL